MRIIAAFCLAALFATLPAAPAAAPQDGKGPVIGGDTVIHRFGAEPPTLNPITVKDAYGSWILYYINGYLYMMDKPNAKLKPELASDFPKISEDKLEWTVPLRKGVRWHDGALFTAHDVKASFDIMMHPKVDSTRTKSYYIDVKEVTVLDDYTVRFTYTKPYYYTLYSLYDFPIAPKHVLDELDDPKNWNDVKYDKPESAIGCGPYKLEYWKKGEELSLIRNEDYWGEKPALKRVRIKFIKDDTAAIQALRRGEIDTMGIPPQNWERDLKGDSKLLQEYANLEYYRPFYLYIGWNMGRDLFKAKKVRKALTMLLDIQDIIKVVYYGYGQQVTGPTYFQSQQYNKDVKPLPYDPEAAKRLLAEEGWADTNRDGVLDKDKKDFAFTFMITTQNPVAEKIATAMKQSYEKAGILVTIRAFEWGAFLEEMDQDKFDCCSLGWSWDWPEQDLYQVWHSSQIAERGSNRVKFNNPAADKLIEDARTEFDDAKRFAMYQRLHEIVYDEQPYTFLFNPRAIVLFHKRFQGVRSYPQGMHPRAGFEWWVPKGQEKYAK
ncbi:MAG: hypothetical protein HYY17_06835 [Planctomycetes bacterium]|nr:hypothetical protein [Planctomycetota bacterium]